MCARSNHGPPSIAVTRAPPRSAISPAAAMSHVDSPPCWMNASNRPLPTYASASAAEPIEREMRMARRTARDRLTAARPLSAIEMTKSETLSLSDALIALARRPERRRQQRGSIGRGRERLAAHRVVHDPDRWPSIDDEADRHAEERDPVGVVHGTVERIDDPDPTPTRGRAVARDRAVLAALFGQDRVTGVPLPDGIDDEGLRQVVRLGHDIACALVVDPLETLVAVDEDLPRSGREGDPEGEIVAGPADRLVGGRRHGSRHVTVPGTSRRARVAPTRTR